MSDDGDGTSTPRPRSFLSRADGSETPRAFLERRIADLEAWEPEIRAFAAVDLEAARRAADAATERLTAGRPASAIDGMPVGIKDIMETADMATGQGSPLFEGWTGGRFG